VLVDFLGLFTRNQGFMIKRALFTFLSLCAITHAEALADRVSKLSLPGRGQYGKCVEYADALSSWLKYHGQGSRVIYYTYRAGLLHRPAAHAIVAWERDGQWWAMGNELQEPRSLGAKTGENIQLAQRYDARAFAATMGKVEIAASESVVQVAGVQSASKPSDLTESVTKISPAPIEVSGAISPANAVSVTTGSQKKFFTTASGTQVLIQ